MIRRKQKKGEIVPSDYWSPSARPVALLRDMDRLFDEFRAEMEGAFLTAPRLMLDTMRRPLVDVVDKGKEYIVKAELPGVTKDDIKVEVSEDSLEISSEKSVEEKEEKEGFVRRERRYSNFYRSIPLPAEVVPGKADAELKEGVLTIRLPKAKPEETKAKKGKKVQVK